MTDILSSNHMVCGEKAFIASIINQAIMDAMKYRNPKVYLKNKQYTKLINLNKKIKETLMSRFFKKKFNRNDMDFMLLCIKVIDFNNRCLLLRNAQLALEARSFIDKNNKLFSFYASIVDVDPESLSEACHKYFKKYDAGLVDKNDFRKDQSNDLLYV